MKKPAPLPLMRFIPGLTTRFRSPLHLAPFVEALERSEREPVHVTVSVPPRHMKTETVKHALARRLLLNPRCRIAYVTYAASFALKNSRAIRQLYERAGGRVVKDANTLTDWRTTSTGTDDGGLWATSVGGAITGEGFDLIIVDDAVKSRALAESGVEREKLVDWYRDTLSTREEPGCSTFVLGARWTPQDLIGHLQAEGWDSITLPALSTSGEALCPDRYSVTALARIKETLGDYGWSSLYQGQPISRGGRVFGDVHFYDALPVDVETITVGIDLAYTAKSHADWSVAVVLARADEVTYVLEVVRDQVAAPDFFAKLAALRVRHPLASFTGFFGGTERGTLDMMRERGIDIEVKPAVLDKFSRAQPVAAAWNAGKVLLPREADWLDDFVQELAGFTGVRDRHDDQVDALAGAYEDSATMTSLDYMGLAIKNEKRAGTLRAGDDGDRRSSVGDGVRKRVLKYDLRLCRPCNMNYYDAWCPKHGAIPDPHAWMDLPDAGQAWKRPASELGKSAELDPAAEREPAARSHELGGKGGEIVDQKTGE